MGNRSKKKKVRKLLEKAERRKAIRATQRHLPPPSFKDNYGNIIRPIELAFPIVRRSGDNEFEAVGTGFFIHPAGGFVTARHCLFNGDEYDRNCFVIDTIGHRQQIREILQFEPHPKGDIGLGMLGGQVINPQTGELILRASFPVSLTPPAIGDKISTLAYPRMTIDKKTLANSLAMPMPDKSLNTDLRGLGGLSRPAT